MGGPRRSRCCHWHQLCYPCLFQLLEQIHKVNFLLHKNTVTFNDDGNTLSNYDIIAWDFRVIGSSSPFSVSLDINTTKIRWHGNASQVTGT